MRLFAGTEFDRPPRCEVCGQLEEECTCLPPGPVRKPPQNQTARVAVEKRKRGKVVTVIRGLAADDNDLPNLLSTLKTQCGAGGTLRDDEIEIQGNQRDRIGEVLQRMGYRVR